MLQQLSTEKFRELYPWRNSTWGDGINYVIPKAVSVSCPHCGVLNAMTFKPLCVDANLSTISGFLNCSNCGKDINLWLMEPQKNDQNNYWEKWQRVYIYPPQKDECSEIPLEVDEDFRRDFKEAALTLSISPRASAALSRYCLQKLIRLKAGIKKRDLREEINELINQSSIPTYLSEQLDLIRHTGNFAVHPNEDSNTGNIIDIDKEEAAYLLEILRELLDFYFVKPAKALQRKGAFNDKLQAAGKNPMQ